MAQQSEKSRQIILQAPDGTFEVIATIEQNEDAAQPPSLTNITKHDLAKPSSTQTDNRELHLILSTGSGHQKAEPFFENVVKPILENLYPAGLESMLIHTTQSETSILELTRDVFFPKANQGAPLRIILASGDGGVIDLVNGLLAQPAGPQYVPPQVILLPLGTANALYHSINLKTENTWGLSKLSSTSTKPLPVFTTTFSPGARLLTDEARSAIELPKDPQGNPTLHGAVVCSWGMHASLVADSDTTEYRKFGVERFKMAAKEALYPADGSAPHAYKAHVSVIKNGEIVALPTQDHMYVLSTLVSNLEAPFCISPATKPLDGSMHLVHFGPTSGDEAMRIMGLAYQGGKHVDDAAVLYEEIDGLRIEFRGLEEDERWRRVCVDGKIVRVEGDGWVEMRKEGRRVVDVVV